MTLLARLERFELPTFWFVARHSIQLSYRRAETQNQAPPELSARCSVQQASHTNSAGVRGVAILPYPYFRWHQRRLCATPGNGPSGQIPSATEPGRTRAHIKSLLPEACDEISSRCPFSPRRCGVAGCGGPDGRRCCADLQRTGLPRRQGLRVLPAGRAQKRARRRLLLPLGLYLRLQYRSPSFLPECR